MWLSIALGALTWSIIGITVGIMVGFIVEIILRRR